MEIVGRKKYCCKYPGCNNWYYTNVPEAFVNKHFFKFPSDPHYHQLWRNICKIEFSKSSKFWRVCEDHFVDSDFVNASKSNLNPEVVPVALNEPSENKDYPLLDDLPFPDENDKVNKGDSPLIPLPEDDVPLCSCQGPSTSATVYSCFDDSGLNVYSDFQNSEVISNFNSDFQDHTTYCLESHDDVPINLSKFAFLGSNKGKGGILSQIGFSEKDLTPTKQVMYKTHRNIKSRLLKLSTLLEKERNKVKILENLYKAGKFEFIDDNLNFVTKEFINSQLRNASKNPSARRWTEQDKAFALSLYKKSPRLYKYLQVYFQLPSSRTLKAILAKIQFDTGVNPGILEHLKAQVTKMKEADRHCVLLFDEMFLCQGFHYERVKQYISGFEDLGSLGRTNKAANHALVFMVRGIRKQWKQVIAYYFTANTVSANNLMFLIKEIISQLQDAGLNVVGTVCDQGTTNQSALTQLCAKKHPRQSSYYFFVNNRPIVTIYDVPHLLKNTRNALLKCKIQFASHKFAKFEHIEAVFNFDQQKTFKSLPKLKREYFNFTDSYMKMKVKVAAAQLSSSVASTIETFVTFANVLPSEAIFTAEFVQKIDDLFDSLNGSSPRVTDHKRFRCAVSENSPHLEFWKKLLTELEQWRLIDLETGTDITNRYSFVRGWQTTIKSVIFLWNHLKNVDGFDYLNLRGLNQDPLENLFSSIRQHGVANTNPTCHQFTAALKTVVVNKLVSPTAADSNCENDTCTPLEDLLGLMKYAGDDDVKEVEEPLSQSEASIDFNTSDLDNVPVEDTQGLAYVAGWVLKNIVVPDCDNCRNTLYSEEVTHRHILTSFRESDNVQRLTYASDYVMSLVQNIHECLYEFLDKNGFQRNLEDYFKNLFKQNVGFGQVHCHEHNCASLILDKCVTFLIYKFCRDKHKRKAVSDGHSRKMKRFKKK